jgi:hypothetical protein
MTTYKRERLIPGERKLKIFNAAVDLCCELGGWNALTRAKIAKRAKCSEGLVSVYLGDVAGLKRRILRYAIKHDYAPIVGQAIASGVNLTISPELRRKAVNAIVG